MDSKGERRMGILVDFCCLESVKSVLEPFAGPRASCSRIESEHESWRMENGFVGVRGG